MWFKIKNSNYQDILKYIPPTFKDSPTHCLQTWYSGDEARDILKNFDHLASEVYPKIQSTKKSFPLIEMGPRGLWINAYKSGQSTGIHNHSDPLFTVDSDYIAICILETGTQSEKLILYNEQNEPENISINPGDIYILHHSVYHGAPPTNDKMIALMFKIKS
jgi:hypothetical protein